MIAIIAQHIVIEGNEKKALELIRDNGRRMSQFPGFRKRYTFIAKDNPPKLSTFTIWDSQEDAARWKGSDSWKERASERARLWATRPQTEAFELVPEFDS